jgi:hypothetical protein
MHSPLKKWLGAFGALALLSVGSAWAQAPQSDDWSAAKLNSFWTFEAIGDNQSVEAQSIAKGALNVTAGGADVWSAPDNFVYVSQKVSGDFRVTVEINSGSLAPPADSYAKAGLMLRSSDDPSAAYLYLFESPYRQGIMYEMRQDDGGTNQSGVGNTQQLPAWLRLTRIGGVIIPSWSSDGVKYYSLSPISDANQDSSITTPVIGMPGLAPDSILVGLATVAHNTAQSANASYGAFTASAVQGGVISGTLTASNGDPMGGATITLVSADGNDTEYATTADDGTYSIPALAGDWSVSAVSATGYADPIKVTLAGGGTAKADIKLKPLASFSWSSASKDTTVSAKILSDPTDATLVSPTDFGPSAGTYDEKNFVDVVIPEEEGNGLTIAKDADYWYRIHFKLPSSFQAAKGSLLYLSNFNMDDSDITFINGHFIGNTVNSWDANRNYMVPSDYLNWDGDNVIAILGTNGGGGAGMNDLNMTQLLSQGPPTQGGVYGKVVTDKGGEAGGVKVTLKSASGASQSATSSFIDGSYNFTKLAPGAYTVTVGTLQPADVAVAGGQAASVPDAKVASIASFGPSDLAAQDLSKLKETDIGATGDLGTWTPSGNSATFEVGGGDIWNTDDDFNYAESPTHVSGDFTAIVSAVPGEGSSDWSKAGIMARVSDDTNSMNVTALNSFFYGARLQYRDTVNPGSASLGNNLTNNLANKIMLTRQGDTFTMYVANSDNSAAFQAGQVTLTGFPKDLIIGLCGTSHAAGTLVTAKFSDFMLSNASWPAAAPSATLGDLNGDGKIAVADATLSLRIAVGLLTPTDAQKAAGDVNKDGKLTVSDTTLILQVAVGIKSGF